MLEKGKNKFLLRMKIPFQQYWQFSRKEREIRTEDGLGCLDGNSEEPELQHSCQELLS